MDDDSEAFIELDTSKLRHAGAIAEAGLRGDVRDRGQIETTDADRPYKADNLAIRLTQLDVRLVVEMRP